MRILAAGALLALTLTASACSSTPDPEPAAAPAPTTTAAATTTNSARPDLTDAQTDQTFLKVLDSYGVNYGTDGGKAAINLADSVCDGLGRGLRESDLMVTLTDPKTTNLTSTDAQNFLNTSIVAYCPDEDEK